MATAGLLAAVAAVPERGHSGLGVAAAEAAVPCGTIDNFNDPNTAPQLVETATLIPGVSATNAGGDPNSILGGERDLELTRTAPALSGEQARTLVSGGYFSWSNNVTVESKGSITWDGPDGNATTLDPTGLGGVNFLAAGSSGAVSFQLGNWDVSGASFRLELWSGPTAVSAQEVSFTAPAPGTLVRLPIADFVRLAGATSAADLSQVGAIVLRFSSSGEALDLGLDNVTGPCAPTAVQPPPSSAAPPPAGTGAPPPAGTGAPSAPNLRLQKKALDQRVPAGGTVGWRLTVRNRGKARANGVRLCDQLPKDMKAVKRGGGKLSGGKLCWKLGRVGPGKAKSRRVVVRIDRGAATGPLANRAWLVGERVPKRNARAIIQVTAAGRPGHPSGSPGAVPTPVPAPGPSPVTG